MTSCFIHQSRSDVVVVIEASHNAERCTNGASNSTEHMQFECLQAAPRSLRAVPIAVRGPFPFACCSRHQAASLGPSWAILVLLGHLGPSWSWSWSWAILGHLGALGPSWAILPWSWDDNMWATRTAFHLQDPGFLWACRLHSSNLHCQGFPGNQGITLAALQEPLCITLAHL
jgi:hypothetical protein